MRDQIKTQLRDNLAQWVVTIEKNPEFEPLEQEGSPAIWMGGGDSLEDQVHFVPEPAILNENSIHFLNLAEFRWLSKYLLDGLLFPDVKKSAISKTHYEYWAITADLVQLILQESRNINALDGLLMDFYSLTELALSVFLLPEERLSMTNLNYAITGGLRIGSGFGFPVLEGIIRETSNYIDDGKIQFDDPNEKLKRADKEIGHGQSRFHLYHCLAIWIEKDSEGDVNEILGQIDEEYGMNDLFDKFSPISRKQSKYGFFRTLYELRNYNVHGAGRSQLVGAINLTLISLVLWDEIQSEEWEEWVEKINEGHPKGIFQFYERLPWTETISTYKSIRQDASHGPDLFSI